MCRDPVFCVRPVLYFVIVLIVVTVGYRFVLLLCAALGWAGELLFGPLPEGMYLLLGFLQFMWHPAKPFGPLRRVKHETVINVHFVVFCCCPVDTEHSSNRLTSSYILKIHVNCKSQCSKLYSLFIRGETSSVIVQGCCCFWLDGSLSSRDTVVAECCYFMCEKKCKLTQPTILHANTSIHMLIDVSFPRFQTPYLSWSTGDFFSFTIFC